MKQLNDIIIWGAGGHATVVADIVRRMGGYELVGFLDDVNLERRGESFCGAKILGGSRELSQVRGAGVRKVIVAIGDCRRRLESAAFALQMGFPLATAIHPKATIADGVNIGPGTVVAAGAVVNPGSTIGSNVIINTCASVDHDCMLGDGVHVCPGVHLGGRVVVGKAVWLGMGSTVIQGVSIGDFSVVGAGAVVLQNLPDRVLAFGLPAKVVRKLGGH